MHRTVPVAKSILMFVAMIALLFTADCAFGVRVLVFSPVAAGSYRHASIEAGVTAIREIGAKRGWRVDINDDPAAFNHEDLSKYDVVVWNNTGGELLNAQGRQAFEQYIQHGGGYVGIHMAAFGQDVTEPNWPWYGRLVGARFKSHPDGTPTALLTVTSDHPSTADLPHRWKHTDEWYEWVEQPELTSAVYLLLTVDEHSYRGGNGYHAVSWCHDFEGGRAFYTALGHTAESFTESNFRSHLAEGIRWASERSANLSPTTIETSGLIVDLDADKGVGLEDGSFVASWTNQVAESVAKDFRKRDEGRKEAGSGRPVLRHSLSGLNGHNSLVFRESELVNENEDAFRDLICGRGYTWIALMLPYAQIGRSPDVNVFLGNLKNGDKYEGFWGGLDDDNTLWMGSRNGVTFGRYDANNPKVVGPRLQRNQWYIVAGRMGAGLGAVPVEIFVDGANASDSALFAVNPNARSSRLAVGQERDAINHPGEESFDGEMARVLLYDRPLTNDELGNTINALKKIYFNSNAK
jgi:type 1 glutamine amidotransferase